MSIFEIGLTVFVTAIVLCVGLVVWKLLTLNRAPAVAQAAPGARNTSWTSVIVASVLVIAVVGGCVLFWQPVASYVAMLVKPGPSSVASTAAESDCAMFSNELQSCSFGSEIVWVNLGDDLTAQTCLYPLPATGGYTLWARRKGSHEPIRWHNGMQGAVLEFGFQYTGATPRDRDTVHYRYC